MTSHKLSKYQRTKKLLLSVYAIMFSISAHSQYPPVFKNSIYGHNPKVGHYINVGVLKCTTKSMEKVNRSY